jgi:hypothetical protein
MESPQELVPIPNSTPTSTAKLRALTERELNRENPEPTIPVPEDERTDVPASRALGQNLY